MWPNPSDHQQILTEYIQSTNDPAATAKSLTAPFTLDSSKDQANGLETVWDAILDAVCDCPPTPQHSPAQARLVDLVAAIKAQGEATSDLPGFGMVLRRRWNDAPPGMTAGAWAGLNGFAARLTARGVRDCGLFGLWSLRGALEVPRARTARESDEAPLEELLPGAVEWVEGCGEVLLGFCREGRGVEREGGPDPTWLGQMGVERGVSETGFSMKRWGLWRERLGEVADARDDAGGREKAAKVAYQGIWRMDELVK